VLMIGRVNGNVHADQPPERAPDERFHLIRTA
jgi:hypothetical protein